MISDSSTTKLVIKFFNNLFIERNYTVNYIMIRIKQILLCNDNSFAY